MAKLNCMYPAPVYHATLDDGRTVRMTVWQDKNAPTKGFDWQICRRTIMGVEDSTAPLRLWRKGYCYDKDAGEHIEVSALERPLFRETGRRIISAHLEQAGEILADDPLTDAKPVKKRQNNGAIMAALKAFMEGKPEARQLAEMALAA
jgi:SspJ family small acid-soluble spore protein